MNYSKENLVEGLCKIEKYLNDSYFPTWEELPSIDLYMDQVVALINQYIKFNILNSQNNYSITAPMVNNYVKLKIMPPPFKKKYTRVHLAYLIIICSLKQTLTMATIQKIFPIGISDEDVKAIYNVFRENYAKSMSYTYSQVKSIANPIIEESEKKPERINDLVLQVAISSNLTKILTETLTDI